MSCCASLADSGHVAGVVPQGRCWHRSCSTASCTRWASLLLGTPAAAAAAAAAGTSASNTPSSAPRRSRRNLLEGDAPPPRTPADDTDDPHSAYRIDGPTVVSSTPPASRRRSSSPAARGSKGWTSADTGEQSQEAKAFDVNKEMWKKLPLAGGIVLLLDTALWGGVGSVLQYAELINCEMQIAIVEAYPVHAFIPNAWLQSAYTFYLSSVVWSSQMLVLRVPYVGLLAHVLAKRLARGESAGEADMRTTINTLFPKDVWRYQMRLGAEAFSALVFTTLFFLYSGLYSYAKEWSPSLFDYLTGYNDVLRGYVGINDWPTDEFLTSLALGMLTAEIFVTLRVGLVRKIYSIAKAVRKL
eukprot:Rhum_TRINITY_DN14653_c11_g1::Rhum_TRINITY_DN14653_c11_g1_i1::g.106935::m.106935